MSGSRVTRILCAADPRGSSDAIDRLLQAADEHDVHAVAMVGDLTGGPDRTTDLRTLFKALAGARRPTYWVPGANDAPVSAYLREAHNIEVVVPVLRGLHGTAAYAPDGHIVLAGHGGFVDDDPDAERDEVRQLRYPRWEPEYRLKIVREFEEHQLVMLFATPPAHKGRGDAGSEALAELINTYRPRLVVCGGDRVDEMLGRSMVVSPGSLAEGHYAIVDMHAHKTEMLELAGVA